MRCAVLWRRQLMRLCADAMIPPVSWILSVSVSLPVRRCCRYHRAVVFLVVLCRVACMAASVAYADVRGRWLPTLCVFLTPAPQCGCCPRSAECMCQCVRVGTLENWGFASYPCIFCGLAGDELRLLLPNVDCVMLLGILALLFCKLNCFLRTASVGC